MGLNEILEKVRKEAEEKVAEIESSTKQESEKIIEQANKEASEYLSSMLAKAESEAKQIITRETSRAELEGRRIVDSEVSSRTGRAIESIRESLQEYRNNKDYAKLLGVLAKSAKEQLGECTLYVQKEDLALINGAKQSKEKFVGGLKAVSSDGKKEVDYTLESILEDMSDTLSAKISKIVKGEQ